MTKPFQTVNQQIEILNRRGLTTDDKTADILLREGYYSIVNGYKNPFLFSSKKNNEDAFKHGATSSEIYKLFLFDRSLRMLLFKYITIAEATLRTITAYEFSQAYQQGHSKYLDLSTYRDDGKYPDLAARFIRSLNSILRVDENGKLKKHKPYIQHYLDNHGHVPAWVLMNCLTLGQTVQFFEFQKNELRHAITTQFANLYQQEHSSKLNIKSKELVRIFDHIKDIRNICAHDEPLYCARVSPMHDTTFATVLDDLGLVLPADKNKEMRIQILAELADLSDDLETVSIFHILKEMGIDSVDKFI